MAPLLAAVWFVVKSLPRLLFESWSAMMLLGTMALVWMQYRRMARIEASLYQAPLYTPTERTERSFWAGLAGGVAGSFLFALTGAGLVDRPGTVPVALLIWPLAALLGLINSRLFSVTYAAPILAGFFTLFTWSGGEATRFLWLTVQLQVLEAALIRMDGSGAPIPAWVNGRGDQAAPGFVLQRFWPVPLLIPVYTSLPPAPDAGWYMLPLVLPLCYFDLAVTALPAEKAVRASRALLMLAGATSVLTLAGYYLPPVHLLAALVALLGREALVVWSVRVQQQNRPFLRRSGRGVAVLDVLPGSPAARGGIRAGGAILAVNNGEVSSVEELHAALQQSSSYVEIMYRNGRQVGHCRIPRPADGADGLGAIPLPRPHDRPWLRFGRPGFFHWFGPNP